MAHHSADHYMRRALQLAARTTRIVLPNPCVGAVVTHNDSIIGEGHHEYFGGPHAEVNAIRAVQSSAALADSTLYVTLEPCAHTGKTPPCVDLIIASKIPRVVIGCRDPHPRVAGRGIQALRAAGIEVIEGVLHDDCVAANSRFILAHRLQRPYIILKWAQSSDGFMAPTGGNRIQISSPESQRLLHYWRGQEMAIAVGSITARNDDPQLTVRHLELYQENDLPPHQPVRIVIGDSLRLPDKLRLLGPEAPSILFVPHGRTPNILTQATTVLCYDPSQQLLPQLCRALYDQQLLSLIVEGGAVTLRHFLELDLWDELRIFTSPIELDSGIASPAAAGRPRLETACGVDTLCLYNHPSLATRLGVDDSTLTPLINSAVSRLR